MSILHVHVNKFVCQLPQCPRNCKHFVLLICLLQKAPSPLPSSQQTHSFPGSSCSPAIGADPWQCSRIRAPEHHSGADGVVLLLCCPFSSSALPRLPSSIQGDSEAITNEVISDALTPKPSLRHWVAISSPGELRSSAPGKACGTAALLGHLGSLEGAHLIQCTAQRFQSISGRTGTLLLRGGLSPFPRNL